MRKILVAYFSRKGNNYLNGEIVNLPIGNTEIVAKQIQELTSGDLFHIDTVQSYPEDYAETTVVAQKEFRNNTRPELTSKVENMDSYDTVFIGYPNWWGTFPMTVFTFLESYDFSGKTIVPFCTHEGSGLGNSVSDIKKLAPSSIVLEGMAIKGGKVNRSQEKINKFVSEITD